MAIQTTTIQREFRYNGIKLSDVATTKTPDQIRMIYAMQYPELLNAVVEGPVTKSGVSVYTFSRAAGSKGAGHLVGLKRLLKDQGDDAHSPLAKASTETIKENQKCLTIVQAIVNDRASSTPILPDSMSYSRFG